MRPWGLIRMGLLASSVMCWHAEGVAQRIRNSPFFGPTSSLELLSRADVRTELELVAEQVTKLRKLRVKYRALLRERFSDLREAGIEDARERAREIMTSLRRDLTSDLNRILLPHQTKRLEQLRLQWQLGRLENIAGFPNEVANSLAITDDQLQQLREQQEATNAEFRLQLNAYRVKARQQILELLTPAQRQHLDELTGAPFRFEESPASDRRSEP